MQGLGTELTWFLQGEENGTGFPFFLSVQLSTRVRGCLLLFVKLRVFLNSVYYCTVFFF